MSKKRWPKVCLLEEIRNIGNRCPSIWGKGVKKAFEKMGDRTGLKEIIKRNGKEVFQEKLWKGIGVKRDKNGKTIGEKLKSPNTAANTGNGNAN